MMATKSGSRVECNWRGKTHGDRVGETILGAKLVTLTPIEQFEEQERITIAAANAVSHKASRGKRMWKKTICPQCFTTPTAAGNCDCD